MEFIRFFESLGKEDASIAGGKGASLGEMAQAGLPVPPGFVVLSDAFERFVEETELGVEIEAALDRVNHKEVHTVENASETIQALILGATMPECVEDEVLESFKKLGAKWVAVRSSATSEDSATAAWAGQLESYLNTTEKDLLEKVKRCWGSLFTPRAIFYRFEKGLHRTPISVAVVVQKMVESEVSGIAFSVHPVTQDHNQLIIEAGYGLGEAIVSGQVTPDSYVVEKRGMGILEARAEKQERQLVRKPEGGNGWQPVSSEKQETQKLSEKQILELSDLMVRIETHYGFPCDIEWAWERGKFYITQSRPITTLSTAFSKAERPLYQKMFARDFCLALVETWCKAESTDPRQWTQKQQPVIPYVVFERTKETVNVYVDPAGIDWVKTELASLSKQDSSFVQKTIDTFHQKAEATRSIWANEKALALEDLKAFLQNLADTWVWFEAVWWLIEVFSGDPQQFERLKRIRIATEKMAPGSDAVIRKSLKKAFPELGEEAYFLLAEEIVSGTIPTPEELQKRKEGYFYTQEKLWMGHTKEELETRFEIRLEQVSAEGNQKTVEGETAYPGFARGTVRRVMGQGSVGSLQEGEILVSSMTLPDFLPAMKRAAALVTDEGGITCHAAIMARELKKPCVIGTRVATQVLKDGDFVGVDADRGIVKKVGTQPKEKDEPPEQMDKRKIIEEIKKIEWHYLVSRREALLFRSITDNGYSLFEKTTSLPWRPTRILRLGEGELFHSKKELETLRDMFSKGGMEPIKRFGRCLVKHVSALERFAKKLGAKDCAKLKDSELSRLAENYFEKALKAQNFLVPLPVADGVLSKKILERLPEAPMKQKEEWLMLLTYSDQENQHTLEEKSFLRLVQSYKKGQHGFNRQLERHLKHFSWIGVRGYNWEREWGKAAILDRIESFLAEGKDPLQKLKEMEATQKEVAKASKEWMAKQRISKGDDDYMLIKLAQQFTYWRTWRTDVIYRAGYEARNLLKEIAQRSNIPGEDIKYLTYKEVIKAAKGEDMPSKPEIENRKTYFAMFLSGENYHVLSGREWEMELRKHVLRARNQGQELKGNSAGPGMARGAAKVVLDANDLWKVGQGDILVAAMTFPHFIAAMEKAAAFVTDEGGITCHAAIIAREMRKPCVIGTKFATQILKDGDLVEVDADRGTVEILKGHRP